MSGLFERILVFAAKASLPLGWLALAAAAVLCAAGCAGQRYMEGTHLALGAYVPFEDGLYGVELVQYTSGAVLTSATNAVCQFRREYASTNEYFWGMVKTTESTRTRLETGGQKE